MNRPLIASLVALGMGIGGFFDGIVLHQILQWHHLICTTESCQPETIAQVKEQTRQDGYFHLGVLFLSTLGSYGVFRSASRPGPARSRGVFFGTTLAGWGLFNLVEGVIDHHVLQIHHVLPGSPHQTAADLAFLASGVLFLGVGAWIARRAGRTVRVT